MIGIHGKAGQLSSGAFFRENCPGGKLVQDLPGNLSPGFPAVFILQSDIGALTKLVNPNMRKQHRKRVEGALRICHGFFQISGGVIFAVQEEIPDTQVPFFSQEAQTVIIAGIPLGGKIFLCVPVAGSLEGHGRGQAVGVSEPCPAVRHGLYTDLSLFPKSFQGFQLRFHARFDIFPEKIVFLSYMGIAWTQRVLLRETSEKPVDPLFVSPYEPGGLQRVDPVEAGAHILFEIVDGIRPQKPEHGDMKLPAVSIGGNIFVAQAGIIDAVGIAAPEGEAVCPHLIPADGAGHNTILFGCVGDSYRIQYPGTYGFGIEAEYLQEVLHVGVHQFFALLRGIADAVGAVHPFVEFFRPGSPEGDLRFLAERLRDFPPGGNLIPDIRAGFQQFLIAGFHESIVFQSVGCRETVLPDQSDLVLDGFEVIWNEDAGLHMGHADEVVNVDDYRFFHVSFSYLLYEISICYFWEKSNLYCMPIKFSTQPDCRPPVWYFPKGIPANPGGLKYILIPGQQNPLAVPSKTCYYNK